MDTHFTSSRVLIAGLGLIGGSVAKALRDAGCIHIDALDIDERTLQTARSEGVIDSTYHSNSSCYDIVICSLAPRLVSGVYETVRNRLSAGGVFTELSGLKTGIANTMTDMLSQAHELLCLHPMAGSEKSGYVNSNASLFRGAPLILTPTTCSGQGALGWAGFLRRALCCGDMPTLSAEAHDALIADLSHLPHIAALAVRAVGGGHEALAGGSYRSVTRVADINAPLWAGLLTDNAEYLLESLARFRTQLDALEASVRARNAAALESLLRRLSAKEKA